MSVRVFVGFLLAFFLFTVMLANAGFLVSSFASDKFYDWVEVHSLQAGDRVLTEDGWQELESIERIDEALTVYNMSVTGPNTYYANGAVVHNKPKPLWARIYHDGEGQFYELPSANDECGSTYPALNGASIEIAGSDQFRLPGGKSRSWAQSRAWRRPCKGYNRTGFNNYSCPHRRYSQQEALPSGPWKWGNRF